MAIVDRISERAQDYDWQRAVKVAVLMPFWLVGYVVGTLLWLIWIVGAFLWAAARQGFAEGRRKP